MTTNTGAHYLSLLLIAAFLLCLAGAAWYISDLINHWPGPAVTCYEDMPCWDCTTMGNLTCGLEIKQ